MLARASWDEDAARDAVRAFLVRHLGAHGGVLIFDETGQAKKGTMTAAAGRQYSGRSREQPFQELSCHIASGGYA
ncbi:MAG: transposase [Pseudomonadota bacterium]|nr:transposase [Pseudomonadota bacterium]